MYKNKFKTSKFLLTKKEIRKQLEHDNNFQDMLEYFDSIHNYNVYSLVDELKSLINIPEGANNSYFEYQKIELIQDLLKVKLDLGYKFHYLLDMLYEEFAGIEDAMNKLEKYDNHRHRLANGLYSEKPLY
jgi:hypothetical protein